MTWMPHFLRSRSDVDYTGKLQHPQHLSYIYLGYFVCVCVCVCVTICVGTISYSFSFINQTDQGGEAEGLKREGLKMER
jgi:hypothetical protein